MSYYFKTWHTEITADLARDEPHNQWLFPEQEDQECSSAVTSPKSINASKEATLVQLGLPRFGGAYQKVNVSALS